MGIPHLSLDLGLRGQCGNRVHYDNIDPTGSHQHVGDFQSLLAGVGLRDEQFIQIDTDLLGITGIKRMLGIDKGGHATQLLSLRDHLKGQCRLAGRFRPVNFNDTTPWQTPATQGYIQRQRASRNNLKIAIGWRITHSHYRPFTELFFDLGKRGTEGFLLVFVHRYRPAKN